ncbi:hypothetical protein EH11_00054 [Bacillus subtilis]|nr:hypothetical protein EH11_00054 [Bacillus subtilis]RUS09327.1 hypothetical protein EFW59_00054 [Bacillus subtilis]
MEAGDTVLVLSQTLLDSDKKDSEYAKKEGRPMYLKRMRKASGFV